MPDHRDRYRTILGSCLSIMVFVLILMYGSYKMVDLMDYKDFSVYKFEKEGFYDMRDPLTAS